MLRIENLHAAIDGKAILNGIDLDVKPGQVHAIMGPNGSGKSTLAHVLAGREGYDVTEGSVDYQGQDLLALSPEERAREGVFLAFQYPVEVPGVSNKLFLKTAMNAQRKHRGEEPLDAFEFLKKLRKTLEQLGMEEKLVSRELNTGFSGGEKKRNEMLQMALLEPSLAVMDETDSGLDIDALRAVADGVNSLRAANRSFVMVTHYQRLLEYVVPDVVHVLMDGKIVKTGGSELALELEERGYDWLRAEAS